ncbi:MAG: GIY-YIG nuclease family protein [bacterium]
MKTITYNNFNVCFIHEGEITKKNDLLELKKSNPKTIFFYKNELNNKKKLIKNLISYLNNDAKLKKVYARDCKILKIIDLKVKSQFLNENHFQGTNSSNIVYGAYKNDKLLAIMTFDNLRYMTKKINKENEYELTRFSVKENHMISGVFGKILKTFIKDYKPKKIITFLDRRFSISNENIYSKNGFKLMKTLSPDYSYYNSEYSSKSLHKFNFGKNKIKIKFPNIYSNNKTEKEMMEELNFIRLWDCGKKRYEIELDDNQKIIFGYIYKITNMINGKIYIGQTIRSLEKRIYEYKKALLYNNSFNNEHLKKSFNKYGFDNFKFEIIDTALDIDELNDKEIKYIKEYDSTNRERGYNIHKGGRNSLLSEETKEKMSQVRKGIKQNENWVKNRVAEKGSDEAKKYGRPKTEEEKRMISEFHKNRERKKWTDEEKKKMSEEKKALGRTKAMEEKLCKAVIRFNIYTKEIKEYVTANDAYENNKEIITLNRIKHICRGTTRNKGNYYWYYKENFKNEKK